MDEKVIARQQEEGINSQAATDRRKKANESSKDPWLLVDKSQPRNGSYEQHNVIIYQLIGTWLILTAAWFTIEMFTGEETVNPSDIEAAITFRNQELDDG